MFTGISYHVHPISHAVSFLHVLHLDVLIRLIESETEREK